MAQTKQNEEKAADYLHEINKPLARYRDDKDLETMLKDQEREDDPMLAYMKQKKKKQDVKEGKKGLILFNCSYYVDDVSTYIVCVILNLDGFSGLVGQTIMYDHVGSNKICQ